MTISTLPLAGIPSKAASGLCETPCLHTSTDYFVIHVDVLWIDDLWWTDVWVGRWTHGWKNGRMNGWNMLEHCFDLRGTQLGKSVQSGGLGEAPKLIDRLCFFSSELHQVMESRAGHKLCDVECHLPLAAKFPPLSLQAAHCPGQPHGQGRYLSSAFLYPNEHGPPGVEVTEVMTNLHRYLCFILLLLLVLLNLLLLVPAFFCCLWSVILSSTCISCIFLFIFVHFVKILYLSCIYCYFCSLPWYRKITLQLGRFAEQLPACRDMEPAASTAWHDARLMLSHHITSHCNQRPSKTNTHIIHIIHNTTYYIHHN